MGRVPKIALVAAALLFVGTAVAYAQLPEPKAHEFPYAGNRAVVWVVAQLHILFAAFILGAPIFVVVSEILGWRNQDSRYERLANSISTGIPGTPCRARRRSGTSRLECS